MDLKGRIAVVTGGAAGIGKALAEGAMARGAKSVVVADLDGDGARAVATAIGGIGRACDVSKEADIVSLVDETEAQVGPIDIFFSNAGIGGFGGDLSNAASAPNHSWEKAWAVNVMAHVYAARALIPRMAARGGGYFVNTVSAAGLLNQIGGAVYGTTKHAAIGFAENIAFSHRDQGIRVSVLCPQGVDTALLRASGHGPQHLDGVLTPQQCADATFEGIAAERFCILPHPMVADYMRHKTADYDRWIGGMAKLQRKLRSAGA